MINGWLSFTYNCGFKFYKHLFLSSILNRLIQSGICLIAFLGINPCRAAHAHMTFNVALSVWNKFFSSGGRPVQGEISGQVVWDCRFDFKFERNLNNTTTQYTVNNDGTIKIVNRGYNYEKKQWKEAIGIAKFVGDDDVAMLKVSIFSPFYSGYNVIAIDNDYKYALVCGNNLSYLWILSRETTIPEDIKQNYLSVAKKLGFNTSVLIWVEHDNK